MGVAYIFFKYLSIFSILPPLVYSLRLLQHTKGRLISQIFWFSAFIALVEAAGWITSYHKINNLWMAHVYIPIEYALLAFMYVYAFDSGVIRRSIIVSVVLFFFFCVFNVVYLEDLKIYNSYPRSIESVFMVSLALLYFYKVFRDVEKTDLFKDPYFLLSVGVIINFAGSSVFNSLLNVMLAYSLEYTRNSLIVLNLLNAFFNTMLVLVLRRAPRA